MSISRATAAKLIALGVADFDNAGHSRCYSQRPRGYAFFKALLATSAIVLAFAVFAAFALPLIGSY